MQLDKIPGGLKLGPDGRQISFAVASVDTLLALETVTNRTVGLIARGVSPHVAPLAPDGRVVLVVNQGPIEFSLIEPTNNMVSATLKVGKAPYWLAVSADGRTAYVANEGSNDASVVDLDSRQGTAPIRAVMLHAKERCSRWYGLVTSPHQAADRGFPGTGWPGNL
jgi:YVTN family beta-propeller protein